MEAAEDRQPLMGDWRSEKRLAGDSVNPATILQDQLMPVRPGSGRRSILARSILTLAHRLRREFADANLGFHSLNLIVERVCR
jgi:hypothetical protein